MHAVRRASSVTLAFWLTLSGAALAQSTGAIEGTVVSRGDGAPAGSVTLIVSAPGHLELRVPDVRVAAGAVTPVTVEIAATPNYLEWS